MTKWPGEDYFADYLPRVRGNPISLAVKRADSTHNLSRIHLIEDARTRERLKSKYLRALAELSGGEAAGD